MDTTNYYGAAEKAYQVVNGTSYDARTPKVVIDILEHSRQHRVRLRIFYGNPETGEIWAERTPFRGHVGRSTGNYKIPLLVKTSRSLGGEALMDHCIVRIEESVGGKVLYQWSKVE